MSRPDPGCSTNNRMIERLPKWPEMSSRQSSSCSSFVGHSEHALPLFLKSTKDERGVIWLRDRRKRGLLKTPLPGHTQLCTYPGFGKIPIQEIARIFSPSPFSETLSVVVCQHKCMLRKLLLLAGWMATSVVGFI